MLRLRGRGGGDGGGLAVGGRKERNHNVVREEYNFKVTFHSISSFVLAHLLLAIKMLKNQVRWRLDTRTSQSRALITSLYTSCTA